MFKQLSYLILKYIQYPTDKNYYGHHRKKGYVESLFFSTLNPDWLGLRKYTVDTLELSNPYDMRTQSKCVLSPQGLLEIWMVMEV